MLSQQALNTHAQLREIDRALVTLQRVDDVARRLATIPGIGPVGATALAAAVTDPGQFRSRREFTALLRLTPLQNSGGGNEKLGRISQMGDKARKLVPVATVAMANKMARIAGPARQAPSGRSWRVVKSTTHPTCQCLQHRILKV